MTAAEASAVAEGVDKPIDTKATDEKPSSEKEPAVTGEDAKEKPAEDKPEAGKDDAQDAVKDAEMEPVKEQADPGVEASMHLIQGKRHILVQDFESAVESLQKACELLSAKHGDDAFECADALTHYGKALLELHRRQSGALNGMESIEEEDEDSDEDDEAEEAEGEQDEKDKAKSNDETGGESSADDNQSKAEGESSSKDEEDLEKPDPALKDPKLDSPPGGSSSGPPTATDGSAEMAAAIAVAAAADEEDASSDLQIAFEVLDLAKNIYKREAKDKPELYLKAADCLLSLGEVGLEADNYQQAIEDFHECLRIQQEMLPKDSRAMAETNYQLGLAYSFLNKHDTSAAYIADAMQILQLKITNLKKFIEEEKAKGGTRPSLDEDPVWNAENEVQEIEKILPEIASKLDDAKEMQREKAEGAKEQVINEMMDRTPEASPVKRETKVNVISSNLIKRKRPLDGGAEGSGESSQAEKKPRDSTDAS